MLTADKKLARSLFIAETDV